MLLHVNDLLSDIHNFVAKPPSEFFRLDITYLITRKCNYCTFIGRSLEMRCNKLLLY